MNEGIVEWTTAAMNGSTIAKPVKATIYWLKWHLKVPWKLQYANLDFT